MVALVTGASSGIGRDIAIELAKRKYDIIAIARNEEALIKLKEEVEKTYNVKVEVKAMDLTGAKNPNKPQRESYFFDVKKCVQCPLREKCGYKENQKSKTYNIM